MSGKELMIGDWVCYKNDNKYHQISSIIMQRDGSILIAIENDLSFDYMFEPIPLTNEILEKSGFSCKGHDHYHFEWHDHYVLAAYPRFGGSTEIFFQSYKMKYRGVIRFVHQLQQALMFCEIEKEIVL